CGGRQPWSRGQLDDERAPSARLRHHANRAAVRLHHMTRDGQPEPRSLPIALARAVGLPEALKDAGEVLGPDADPGVAHHQLDPALLEEGTRADRDPALRRGELDRVVNQVAQHLTEPSGVTEK